MIKLRYNLNGVWLETDVADAYTLGTLFKTYTTFAPTVSEVQGWLGDTLVIAWSRD
jgi:hypothetical protein